MIYTVAIGVSIVSNKFITSRQKLWFNAVQERVSFTSYMLLHMKEVKILGLGEKMKSLVHYRRCLELKASQGFRRAWALRAVLGRCPAFSWAFAMLFNPFLYQIRVVTLYSDNMIVAHTPHSFIWLASLGGYAIAAPNQVHERRLGTLEMVTALSKTNLLIIPLGQVLNTTAQLIAAMGCFQRIQDFLCQDEIPNELPEESSTHETTGLTLPSMGSHSCTASKQVSCAWHQPTPEKFTETTPTKSMLLSDTENHSRPSISLLNVTIGWRRPDAIIRDCNFTVTEETLFTVITGPTGCGKSTLLKAIVGEAPILDGRIVNNIHRVAFCDQVPWFPNGTIRDIILGDSHFEESWYSTVISACALDTDLLQMPKRDITDVGSQAINLSGGQKQRIVSNLTDHSDGCQLWLCCSRSRSPSYFLKLSLSFLCFILPYFSLVFTPTLL